MPLLIFISSHDRRAEMQIWPEVSIESLIPRCSLRPMALLLWKKLKIFKNASMSMQMHIFNIITLFIYSIYKFLWRYNMLTMSQMFILVLHVAYIKLNPHTVQENISYTIHWQMMWIILCVLVLSYHGLVLGGNSLQTNTSTRFGVLKSLILANSRTTVTLDSAALQTIDQLSSKGNIRLIFVLFALSLFVNLINCLVLIFHSFIKG